MPRMRNVTSCFYRGGGDPLAIGLGLLDFNYSNGCNALILGLPDSEASHYFLQAVEGAENMLCGPRERQDA